MAHFLYPIWHMKYFYLVLIFVSLSVAVNARPVVDVDQPQRTPEEIARKQTFMLVRELSLTDSVVIDSLYRINLRHNKRRMNNNITRAEQYSGMQEFINELRGILTPDQFQRFMNNKADAPRHPHASYIHSRPDSTPRRQPMP